VTRAARAAAEPWIWLAALIAFADFSAESDLGDRTNHWPTIEILRNVDRMKNMHVTWRSSSSSRRSSFIPWARRFASPGLWFFLRSREGERLPLSRMDVFFPSRRVFDFSRAHLLPGADLSHAIRGRRRGDRGMDRKQR
jgi:hypothetical protein